VRAMLSLGWHPRHIAGLIRSKYDFVIHPGPEEPKQLPGKEYFQRLENVARTLSIIAERCRYLGMTCVLENKLPHLLFGDVRDIIWILEALKGADVGVCLLDTPTRASHRDESWNALRNGTKANWRRIILQKDWCL
jgi:hypothetical protein